MEVQPPVCRAIPSAVDGEKLSGPIAPDVDFAFA
jgi:hypothetical protein